MKGVNSRKVRLTLVAVAVILLTSASILALDFTQKASPEIQIAKVWSDRVDAPSGMLYYLVDVNASNISPTVWHLDPSLFAVTSNASLTYPSTVCYNETALLGKSDIAPGQHVTGEVAFEMPANQQPSKLNYADSVRGITIVVYDIPPVSGVATRFDPHVHYLLNGTSWANTITTVATIANDSRSYVFFTGQKIYVSFAFYYYKRPIDPSTIAITSVTNDDGFPVSGVQAMTTSHAFVVTNAYSPLPIAMTGYGSNAVVVLLVTVPPGRQFGVLHFTVQFAD